MAEKNSITVEEAQQRALQLDRDLDEKGVVLPRPLNSSRTLYDLTMPERLLRFAMTGMSKGAFAGALMIHPNTLLNWCRLYPEFKEAYELFDYVRQHRLEMDALTMDEAPMIAVRLRALSRLDSGWVDRKEVGIGGAGEPIRVSHDAKPSEVYRHFIEGRVVERVAPVKAIGYEQDPR